MKAKCAKELEQLKHLKMQGAMSKIVGIIEEKEKQYVRRIKYTYQGHLHTKVNPDIDFIDEAVVQYKVPVLENTFVDNCN